MHFAQQSFIARTDTTRFLYLQTEKRRKKITNSSTGISEIILVTINYLDLKVVNWCKMEQVFT